MTSETFMALLESKLFEEDLAEGTVERTLVDGRQFAEWYEGTNGTPLTVEALESLPSADLKDFRAYLTQRKLAPSTIIRKFESVRKAFRLLAPERLSQLVWVKLPNAPITSPSGFTTVQRRAIKRAIEKMGARDSCICTLALTTGARASSIANARLSRLSIKERSGSITYEGKGRKVYSVPLNAEARAAVKRWLAVRPSVQDDDHLFLAERFPYKPISRWCVHSIWHSRLKSLLPPQVAEVIRGPHQARHDLARRALSGDEGRVPPVPLADVAAILSHSSPMVTASIYARPSKENLQSALDRLSDEE